MRRLAVPLGVLLLVSSCAPGAPNALDPRGHGAAALLPLWWIMLGLGAAVAVVVFAILGWALFRKPGGERSFELPMIVWGGVLVPVVIIAVVSGASWWTTVQIDLAADEHPLEIEVVGHKFWWEVRYPDPGFVTANEIHVPVGRAVDIDLVSEDVIHSFWVPQIHGKIDMVPGRTNRLRLQVDEPGSYLGKCAEYCGIQHANMRFLLVAHDEEAFEAWLERESADALPPPDEQAQRGLETFLGTTCVACHAIRGTQADARVGPDLTHLASRRTLAAGTVPNRPGYLGGWILDPQSMKPGNLMPPTTLTPEEFHDLMHYLQALE